MPAKNRLQMERVFHDRQATQRATSLARTPDKYLCSDADYLDHESWIRPAFDQLGEVRGLRVLDFGCGHGMAAVVLARRGAIVTGIDLSAGYVEEAKTRGRANGVSIGFVQADAERLPFADHVFDRIWGHAILHHLDLKKAAAEIHRVLKPGGRAVFCEPWGENPLLSWARSCLPYPSKHRTADERPLCRKDLRPFQCLFANVDVRGFQLIGMARLLIKSRKLSARLDWCDAMLLSRVPRLEQFCRYVVLTLSR